MLGEIRSRFVGDPPQAKRVAAARRGVIHARPCIRRWIRGHGQHRVDDEVGWDDVEQRIWQPREIPQDVATKSEDQRLGHPESLEPAAERFVERALDDRRPHDGQRDIAVQLDHRLLGHRLGE